MLDVPKEVRILRSRYVEELGCESSSEAANHNDSITKEIHDLISNLDDKVKSAILLNHI